ncbi:MAG: hypothetical protein BWK79_17310 [Beggiatoa sp. IS2]|nr:MAG: hypothetical protein BWK79_17310 [Beggiatoa sp. IS2]
MDGDEGKTSLNFNELFDISPALVIEQMDKAGDDIPLQDPPFSISVNEVGLTREDIPIQIKCPFRPNNLQYLSCTVRLHVNLPATKRGVHISRLNHAIAEHSQKTFGHLQDYVESLARTVSRITYQNSSQVFVSGKLAYFEDITGWKPEKNKISLEQIGLHCEGQLNVENQTFLQNAGITFSHITACPCVQQTMKHVLLSKDIAFTHIAQEMPFLTHSQRCKTTVTIKNISGVIPLLEMLQIIDKVVFRVRNTLPRENELLLVFKSHKKPQFIEDVVREIPVALYPSMAHYLNSSIETYSVSMESIHDFDIYAKSEYSMSELKRVLEKQA